MGVLLLTGLLVVLVTVVGTTSLAHYAETGTDDSATFNCRIGYADENVTVTHAGGDSVPTNSLGAVVRNDSGQARRLFSADGDAGANFETGERVKLGPLNESSDVLVATDSSIACQDRLAVRSRTGTSTPTPTPTPTPTATPTPTPTPTP
ncbi:MAG: type IV pilin, partial [Haloferacaceae archaeon]